MTNQDGSSPLHVAALHGRVDLIPLLLKHGADAGARNVDQAVPLHLACQKGHFQVRGLSPGQRAWRACSWLELSLMGVLRRGRVGGGPRWTHFLPPSRRCCAAWGRTDSLSGEHSALVLLGAGPPLPLIPVPHSTAMQLSVAQRPHPDSDPSRSCLWCLMLVIEGSAYNLAPFIPTALGLCQTV